MNKRIKQLIIKCLLLILFMNLTYGMQESLAETSIPKEIGIGSNNGSKEIYQNVLSDLYTAILNGNEGNSEREDIMTLSLAIEGRSHTNALSEIGYTIQDINGDDVPEMLVGEVNGENGELYAIYTQKGGKPHLLHTAVYRNSCGYMGDGIFFNSGSSSAVCSTFGTYVLSKDGSSLSCKDLYFTDVKEKNGKSQIAFYHNTSGEVDKSVSEELDIPEDAFWQIEQKLAKQLQRIKLTPFSSLKAKSSVAKYNLAKHYAWTGKIGKNIPISVWIEVRPDGLAAGEIVYTKSGKGKPIMLLGKYTEKNNELYLTEYQPDGFQSGFIEGKITTDNIFRGNWKVETRGSGLKKYVMTLDSMVNFPKDRKSLLQPANTKEIGGEYSFRYLHSGGSEPFGNITVDSIGNEVRFDVYSRQLQTEIVYSNKNDDKPVKLAGNKFSYITKDHKISSFECEFFEKFIYISNLKNGTDDYTNYDYSLEGFYVKNQQK